MSNIQLMIQHLEAGNNQQAEKIFNQVKSSNNDEEKYQLADELLQLGFLHEAKELFELLLNTYPDESELKIFLAEILIEMDKEEEAILYLDTIVETDPDYPRSLLILADLYQMQGLYEVSEKKLLLAKETLPTEPIINFALGELYASLGRNAEAVRYYQILIGEGKLSIAGVNIHGRLGDVLSSSGAFEDALPHYEKAMDDHVEINTLFGYAFTAYRAEFYKKAIQLFHQLKELDPEYHSLYLYLGKAYESEEELSKALETVKEGIAMDDFNKELFQFGGKIALKLGDEQLAEEYFRNALVLDSGYIDAAYTLNKLLLHQHRYEDVIEITSMMEKESESDPQFYWDAAHSFYHTEQYSDALKYYQLAYNDLKNNNEFLSEYGYFLIEEGEALKAAKIFQSLVQEDPTNEEWVSILERLEDK